MGDLANELTFDILRRIIYLYFLSIGYHLYYEGRFVLNIQ